MRRTVAPHWNVTHATRSALKPPNVKPLTVARGGDQSRNGLGVTRR
jgi:hypothetical protein